MADTAANQQRNLLFCGNTAGRFNGRDHRVSCQNHPINIRGLRRAAEIVLRQPFTDSIDGRQRGVRQDGKMGLNHGELLLCPFRVATSTYQHNGDIGRSFSLNFPSTFD
jgi:hypothetical protein